MERGQMQHFGFAGASRWLMTKSILTKIEYIARFYLHKNVDCRADKKITEIMPINDDGCRNGFYFWLNSEFWIRTASYFFLRILSKPEKKSMDCQNLFAEAAYVLPELLNHIYLWLTFQFVCFWLIPEVKMWWLRWSVVKYGIYHRMKWNEK